MRSTLVITGVTRGLGRALAEQFSFLGGYKLVFWGIISVFVHFSHLFTF